MVVEDNDNLVPWVFGQKVNWWAYAWLMHGLCMACAWFKYLDRVRKKRNFLIELGENGGFLLTVKQALVYLHCVSAEMRVNILEIC